jgi:hypothetical protein
MRPPVLRADDISPYLRSMARLALFVVAFLLSTLAKAADQQDLPKQLAYLKQ